jgi:hypothetical protein
MNTKDLRSFVQSKRPKTPGTRPKTRCPQIASQNPQIASQIVPSNENGASSN